jgi:hypothetical protein
VYDAATQRKSPDLALVEEAELRVVRHRHLAVPSAVVVQARHIVGSFSLPQMHVSPGFVNTFSCLFKKKKQADTRTIIPFKAIHFYRQPTQPRSAQV